MSQLLGAVDVPEAMEPVHVRCECGKDYLQVWFDADARRAAGKFVPRGMPSGWWVAPKVSPCPHCAQDASLAFEREVSHRLYASKLPPAYHRYNLDPEAVVVQRKDEPTPDFMARARQMSKFGALDANLKALRDLKTWLRSNDGRVPKRWVVIHGPPGTGKTAMLGAIARSMVAVEAMTLQDIPDHVLPFKLDNQDGWDYAAARGLTKTWTSRARPKVAYEDMGDLLERHTAKFKGEHNDEAKDAAHVDVLLLDEFGTNQKPREPEHEMIKGLIVQRHNHQRLTVIGTNRTWEELTTKGEALYGDAVADRLRSALRVQLGGPSWR